MPAGGEPATSRGASPPRYPAAGGRAMGKGAGPASCPPARGVARSPGHVYIWVVVATGRACPLPLEPMTATTARPRLPRTLADLEAHPWVEWIDDSRHLGDGLHVYLRPGYVWDDTVSAVVEPTVREACQAFRDVTWNPAAWAVAGGHSAAEVAALTGEAAPAPSIADAALEASAALNAIGEAATSRALAGLGRIRAGLEALEALDSVNPPTLPQLRADAAAGRPVSLAQVARSIAADAARRPTLPGEATPPPAPSHGEAAPVLPVLTEHPCPVGNGDPARAEAVVEVPGGVAVICGDSPREAFRLPDNVSLCGAAAALEAGGWILSPALEALARRWRDLTGGQDPAPDAVAIAEAAAPKLKRFEVFHRTWWRRNPEWPDGREPGVGKSHHVGWANTEAHARHLCRRWNATHTPGPLSDQAEYTAS